MLYLPSTTTPRPSITHLRKKVFAGVVESPQLPSDGVQLAFERLVLLQFALKVAQIAVILVVRKLVLSCGREELNYIYYS